MDTVVKSYAKINVVLNVLGKHDEKFHEIDMVMLPLELHDSLLISKIDDLKDNYVTFVDCSLNGGFEYNLASRALEQLTDKTNIKQHFRILINKCIPISAGLGGGSSNCAATLKGINKMCKLNLSNQELAEIGFKLGSDVPYFIYNKPARVRGAGEIVEPIEVKNDYYALIVKPKEGLSTKIVYENCDTFDLKKYDVDKVILALKTGDDEMLAKEIGNALEDVSISLLPEVKKIKEEMKGLGLKIVLMSGSGSSVFALSTDKKAIKNAYKHFLKQYAHEQYDIELTKVIK